MKRTLIAIDESTITFDLCKQALLDASLSFSISSVENSQFSL